MERVILVRIGGAIIVATMLMLGGCSTSSNPTSVTMVPSAEAASISKPAPQPPVAVRSHTNSPAPLARPVTPTPQPQPQIREPEPVRGWVGIDHWVRANDFGRVRVVANGPQPKLELIAPAGRMEFAVGSQFAKWNGLSFMLGFAPQISSREISVNGFDLQKSFVPLLQQRSVPIHGRVIVIDPGHGGALGGTKSVVGNHSEKDFTLDWALRLQTLLASNGWRVYLTRTNDADIPLQDRVAVADRVNADLFISLHFNSAGAAESGIETYCMTPFGMPSNLTRGYVDDPFYNWPNNAFDRENFTWAMRLHRSLISEVHAPDRGVRRARFMAVLRTQRRPAVLIEGGYLSNRHEATLINLPDYRQKLAQAVADVFPAIHKP
jgi:N-acetylmuramoyl-L-alanine amidase